MALPSGRVCITRPDRQFPRKYTAKDCGRMVRYARQAGESEAEICEAIATDGGLQCGGDCDCERIRALVGVAIGVVALAIATRARNKQAMKLAREAIQKAMESSKATMGKIELEKVDSYLLMVNESEEELNNSLDRLQELLIQSDATDFNQAAKEPQVIIKP